MEDEPESTVVLVAITFFFAARIETIGSSSEEGEEGTVGGEEAGC